MGLFNFLKKNKAEIITAEPELTESEWDSLKQERFAGDQSQPEQPQGQAQPNQTPSATPNAAPRQAETQLSPERAQLQRQGDKFIATFYHGPNALGQPTAEVSEAERDDFLDRLTTVDPDREFTPAQESYILQNIQLPSGKNGEKMPQVFDKINTRHGLTILNFAGQYGIQDHSQLGPNFLQHFLQNYPTPVEFQPRGEELLQILRDNNVAPLKIDQYEDDLKQFQKDIYGKRYEYFQAVEELRDQAYSRNKARADADSARERAANMQKLQTPVSPERAQAELENNSYASPEARKFYEQQ